MLSLYCSLNSVGTPNNTIQTIFSGIHEISNCVVDDILNLLKKRNLGHQFEVITNYSNSLKNTLAQFSSVCKRNKLIPKSYYLKNTPLVRRDQRFDKKLQTFMEVNVPITFSYVPILETLQFLFKFQSFRSYVENYIQNDNNDLKDIDDGTLLKSTVFWKDRKGTIKLHLYYDEFETTNPLGSKTGVLKLGAIYFIVRNIPPHLNTHLKNIHLATLFFVEDLKSVSFNRILQPLVTDLKILENEGIQLNGSQVYGSLVAISFDNLGGNVLYGIVESFSAKFFCRLCLINKNDLSNVFNESHEKCILRNNSSYENFCIQLQTSSENNIYGIKEKTVLNDLKYFKIFDVPTADIMHDLEGVVQYEIKLFLSDLVVSKIIKLECINPKISNLIMDVSTCMKSLVLLYLINRVI